MDPLPIDFIINTFDGNYHEKEILSPTKSSHSACISMVDDLIKIDIYCNRFHQRIINLKKNNLESKFSHHGYNFLIDDGCHNCRCENNIRLQVNTSMTEFEYLQFLISIKALELKTKKYELKQKIWKNGDPFQNYLDFVAAEKSEFPNS